MLKKLLFIPVFICFMTAAHSADAAVGMATDVKKDTSDVKKKKGPELISGFIKPDAEIVKGLTTLYAQEGKYYININDSLIGRDIRMVSRISKAAEGVRSNFSGYAGDIINSAMFRFEKGPDDKIFLKSLALRERSDSIMAENVANSNFPAIVEAFEIKAQSPDKTDNLIEIGDFLLSDSEYLFFPKRYKKSLEIGSLQKDKSYISSIRTFPINTEFKVVHTYARQMGSPTITYELNASFVLLPEVPMTPRYADDRVGYFTVTYTDFDRNPQKVERTSMITRWRLEPKPEDVEKYKNGELVEPAKPIVFYIDPATPKEWVPYLIQGVNDWQAAFEKAGFKNAIYALEAPTFEEDSTWSLEDARHSAIVYKPSSIANASGPHVNDPRSGEIIESHINWYHNVMSLLNKWYFVQCSPSDTGARKVVFDSELMGQLIRFVSSHEVGHTLGLRHNFIGSAIYDAEQLRDVEFLKKNGHATSIMDYARFNYVAQPKDNIPRELLFPRINHYDKWAIEWGYRRFPEIDDPVKELPQINGWIVEKTKNPYLLFGTERSFSDPRLQSEDLGSDHTKSNEYGIRNLKYIMKHIEDWTILPNEGYDNLKTYHGEVVSQYRRYLLHVAKWIGGIYETPKSAEQPGEVYRPVEKRMQKKAMEFLAAHLADSHNWLVPENILAKTGDRAESVIGKLYQSVFNRLLDRRVMTNLYYGEMVSGEKAYTMENLYEDLNSMVWGPMPSNKRAAMYKRLMQKYYVNALLDLYTGDRASSALLLPGTARFDDNADILSMAYYQLVELQKKLASLRGAEADMAHYRYLSDLIDRKLELGHLSGYNI